MKLTYEQLLRQWFIRRWIFASSPLLGHNWREWRLDPMNQTQYMKLIKVQPLEMPKKFVKFINVGRKLT